MNRIVFWLLTTVTVVVLLFGYHTSTSGPEAALPVISAPDASSGDDASSTTTTVTGSAVDTQWGPVEVRLSIAAGKITDVQVVEYPDGNGRDAEINSYALPQLIQETLDAQSAQIDMVSGATVTSGGYVHSLQSALDKAGL